MFPSIELHGDRSGDERDADHRQQLEHERREERDPQRLHRLAPVGLTGLLERALLRVVAIVRAQRLEAAHDVEEVRAEQRERLPALLGRRARGEPDEDHEQRDHRDGQQQDEPGREVVREDVREDHDRNEDPEHDLGEVAGEVRLERVNALDGGRDEVARTLLAQPARARAQDMVGQAGAQLGHDAPGAKAP